MGRRGTIREEMQVVAEISFPIVLRSFADPQHYICSHTQHMYNYGILRKIQHVVGRTVLYVDLYLHTVKAPSTQTHNSTDYQEEMTAFPVNMVVPWVCRLLIRPLQ